MSDRNQRILFALILLSCACFAHGQGAVSVGPPVATNGVGQPLGGLTVAICNANPGATPGSLCSGGALVPTFTDITLTTACSGTLTALNNQYAPTVGSGCSNPGLTDGQGNVVAFAAAGNYWCEYQGAPLGAIQVQVCAFPGTGSGGGGGSSGTINTAAQYSIPQYQTSGLTSILSGYAPGTAPGTYFYIETPVGGSLTQQVMALPGVKINPVTSCPYTYKQTDTVVDRAAYTTFSSASACAVNLPQAGSLGFTSNWVNETCNIGAGTVTITPNTSTISYTTGSAYVSGASSIALSTGQCAWLRSDNANYFANLMGGSVGGGGISGSWTSVGNLVTTFGADTAQDSGMCLAHYSAVPGPSDQITAAGLFATTISMPDTCLAVGTMVTIRFHGVYTTTSTATPKMGWAVNALGGSQICTQASYTISPSVTNGAFDGTCIIKINTTGAPGTAVVWGPTDYTTTSGVPSATLTGAFFQSSTGTGTVGAVTNAIETVSIQELGALVSGQTFNLTALDITVQL
jgi:hypothetical protein